MPALAVTWVVSSLACAAGASAAEDSLRSLWERGKPFQEFLAATDARRDTWHGNYAWGRLADDVTRRLADLTGTWRLLVIAESGCGDSANTIPYLAILADSAAGRLEIRVIDSKIGQGVMEAHRTADGRAATPTVILLDSAWHNAGCWVERPSNLAVWFEAAKARLGYREALEEKYRWYDRDRGGSTHREILSMIEQAGPGRPCGGNTRSSG